MELDQNDCLYTEKQSVRTRYREKPEECIKPKEIPEKIYDFLENLEDLSLPKFISIRLFSLEEPGGYNDFKRGHKWNVSLHECEFVNTGFSHYDYESRRQVWDTERVDIKSHGIPVDISIATDMRSLDAKDVSVKKIPPSFSKLTKLESLDLRENPDLTELPDFLWKMPRLRELNIDDRLIGNVPPGRVIIDKVLNRVSDKDDLEKKFRKVIKLLEAWKNREGLSNRDFIKLFDAGSPINLKPLS